MLADSPYQPGCFFLLPLLALFPTARFRRKPPGDSRQPEGPLQTPRLSAWDAGVRLPQADHQGH